MKISAGIVLYRIQDGKIEVLLGHMGGPFWAKRDAGAWSIPKGLIEPGEDPLDAALRECEEEFGFRPDGEMIPLDPIHQKGGRKVIAWAMRTGHDPADHKSNSFTMEWPPRSGRYQQFPEIDRVQWFPLAEAMLKVTGGQADLLRQLEERSSST